MEIVKIERVTLETGFEYYSEKQAHYEALEMTAMAQWCEGKASVYKHLLDTYAK